MPLTPIIVARLIALKSLLDADDVDLAKSAALRLEAHRSDHPTVAKILDLLKAGRFTETSAEIVRALAEGTRVEVWIDPEVRLLEAELEQVCRELAAVGAEHAELLHRVAQFEGAQEKSLGERLHWLMGLRVRLKQLLAMCAGTDAKAEMTRDYEEACREQQEFEGGRNEQRELGVKSNWRLSEEEQAELKRCFREASKRSHPDVVAPEHRESAAKLFRELREAYEKGDQSKVRAIAERARLGFFELGAGVRGSGPDAKALLVAKVTASREALKAAIRHFEETRTSPACQAMAAAADWEAHFAEQAELLDKEIQRLSLEVGILEKKAPTHQADDASR